MKDLFGRDYSCLLSKKLFLFDMDGTIYHGNELFPYSLALFKLLRDKEINYKFMTNNSSKSIEEYVSKVKALGIEVSTTNFITSSQATAVFVKNNYPDIKFLVVGTRSFFGEMKQFGVNVCDSVCEKPKGIIVGYDTELTYKKIDEACYLLTMNPNIPFIATNPDFVCPTQWGFVPDCGSICDIIKIATGKSPIFIGKPSKLIIEMALDSSKTSKDDSVVIGDRLYTDILCGINSGITTIAVLTGETSVDEINTSSYKPTFTINSVKDIFDLLVSQS